MPLTLGMRLGSYEVAAPIGAGGMGEVYRARDTKLNRDVALKILPAEFTVDGDRLARFKREAQVLASLNHPNIAAIYGLEESDGVQALVLELVDGSTLGERIAQGAIPLDDALPIARQIADALEAAHEQGIVHRDLKPANIKVRPDGTVKVLDFGLAKALEAPAGAGTSATMSPTITTPAMTQAGVILGTAAYMSPEQAKGRPADRRSDIWAFGCVLFEMLTGRRAFEGDDVSDTLAAVLRGEPDWALLPASTPTHIKKLLRRCVQKDPRKRLPHIAVARLDMDEPDAADVDTTAAPPRRPLWIRAAPYVAAIAATIVVTALVLRRADVATTAQPVQRLTITFPPTAAFQAANQSSVAANPVTTGTFAISPDGSRIVYVGQGAPNGARSLFVRFLDQLDPRPLPGTENAWDPFFSPDGEWVGFLVGNGAEPRTLKKVALRGGAPVAIASSLTGAPAGASWGRNDLIVFSMGLRLGGTSSTCLAGI
jgi:eukaryotic-like serine/threonine-protein kinase